MSIRENPIVLRYFLFLTVLVALGLGSFLHCAAYRMARHENFIKGSSRCPHCGHDLKFWDLIPILSYLFLRGKCRYCKQKISPRYLLFELLYIFLMISNLLCFDLTFVALRNVVLLSCLFVLSIVDYEAYEIPNSCILLPAVAWAGLEPFCYKEQSRGVWWIDAGEHVATMLLFTAFILLIRFLLKRLLKKQALGMGDVKLLALMGLYLTILPVLFALILACILGLLYYFLFQKRKEAQRGAYFPFGPALSVSFWVMLCVGDPFVKWYLHYFI